MLHSMVDRVDPCMQLRHASLSGTIKGAMCCTCVHHQLTVFLEPVTCSLPPSPEGLDSSSILPHYHEELIFEL